MDILIYLPLILFVWAPIALYYWYQHRRNYFKRNNVPHIDSELLFGNIKNIIMLRNNVAEEFAEFYNDKKTKNDPFVGILSFHKPIILLKDPELIKRVLVKDFNLFADRYAKSSPHTDGLSNYNLFFITNPIWKEIRTRITPVFTSGKMRQLFGLMEQIGTQLGDSMGKEHQGGKKVSANQNIKNLCAQYATDVILSCAFGITTNSIDNPETDFRKFGQELVEFNWWRAFEFNSFFFLPEVIRLFNFKIFPEKIANLLRNSIEHVMNDRVKTGKTRNDIIDVLVQLRDEDKDKTIDKFSAVFQGDILYAQGAVFFFAGFETTSSLMSFGLYELAHHPALLDRLRNEIKELYTANNGVLTYDAVMNAPYIEMVVKEILRMYPPLPFLDRQLKLPKGQRGYSLQPFSDFEIPDNMGIMIPVYALHTDPKYFPNPFKFDPERFSPENEPSINPYTYLPFGTGPRNCIGMRFGLLQAKVGLINILKNFRVVPNKTTIYPMTLEKKATIVQAKGGIFLDIVHDPLF